MATKFALQRLVITQIHPSNVRTANQANHAVQIVLPKLLLHALTVLQRQRHVQTLQAVQTVQMVKHVLSVMQRSLPKHAQHVLTA